MSLLPVSARHPQTLQHNAAPRLDTVSAGEAASAPTTTMGGTALLDTPGRKARTPLDTGGALPRVRSVAAPGPVPPVTAWPRLAPARAQECHIGDYIS
jgi:hypothetical protein